MTVTGSYGHALILVQMVANRFAGVAVTEGVADVIGDKPRLVVAGNDANGEDAEVEGGDVSHGGLQVF